MTYTYEELIEIAERCYNEHNYQNVVSCTTQAIELDKNKPDGYYWRGISYEHLEHIFNKETRYKDAESLLTCKPLSVLHLVYRGWAYYVKREYKKSVEVCTEALKQGYEGKKAYYYRALAHVEMKSYDSAISDYNRLKELDPRSAIAYNRLGEVYREQKNFDMAIENYTKAIELGMDNADIYLKRGYAFFQNMNTKPQLRILRMLSKSIKQTLTQVTGLLLLTIVWGNNTIKIKNTPLQ